MRSWRLTGLGLMVLACVAIFAPAIFHSWNTVYATPETESAFLKAYNPEPIVTSFKSQHTSSGWESGMGASAGEGFARHWGSFRGQFEIADKDSLALMVALRHDLSAQLARTGASVVTQIGGPLEGFRYDYELGNSSGWVAVYPLKTRNEKACPGESAVELAVTIEETFWRDRRLKP